MATKKWSFGNLGSDSDIEGYEECFYLDMLILVDRRSD